MAIQVAKNRPSTVAAGSNGGFRPVTSDIKYRLILCVEGLEGSGKTHFSLTAPSPIYYQSLDIGEEGVVNKFSQKAIFKADYRVIVPTDADESVIAEKANAVWAGFCSDYRLALQQARSVVWDTESEAWELIRLARSGRLSVGKPHHYAPINAEYRDLVRSAFDSSCNLICLGKLKDEYANDKRTGGYKRAGFTDMPFMAQVRVRSVKEDSEYSLEILKCRQNPSVEGIRIPNDFSTLAQMVFPDSSTGDWE